MKVTVTVCDVCHERDRETRNYVVQVSGKKTVLDLCEEDGRPIDQLLEAINAARAGQVGDPRRAPSTRKTKVTTLAEIEKIKQSS